MKERFSDSQSRHITAVSDPLSRARHGEKSAEVY